MYKTSKYIDDRLTCDYLDLNKQPSSDMLRKCIQDSSKGYDFNCQKSKYINYADERGLSENLSIKRGVSEGMGDLKSDVLGIEGFTDKIFISDNGPGESVINFGECPDGYAKRDDGTCVQVCVGCKYTDNMKSQEFNEYDPCFPNGTYDGITNEGNIKCTCGMNNKYCSNNFIKNTFLADGMLVIDNKIKNNIGMTNVIDNLFIIDQL